MKKILFAVLLITGLNAAAQTESAFFARDSAAMINITRLVLESAKNKYHFEKAFPQKWSAEFWYRNDSAKTVLVRIAFKLLSDKSGWVLTHVSGVCDDIFPFWKKYFDADAVLAEKLSAKEFKYITNPFLKGKTMYHFARINSQMGEIQGGYVPDR